MSMQYIRRRYGVPAKRGLFILYTGKEKPLIAKIISSSQGKINARTEEGEVIRHMHPTWKIKYLKKGQLTQHRLMLDALHMVLDATEPVTRKEIQKAVGKSDDYVGEMMFMLERMELVEWNLSKDYWTKRSKQTSPIPFPQLLTGLY